MREHSHSRRLRFDLSHRGELRHVGDTIDDGIDLSAEYVAMCKLTLCAADLHFPAGIEEVLYMALALLFVGPQKVYIPAQGRI